MLLFIHDINRHDHGGIHNVNNTMLFKHNILCMRMFVIYTGMPSIKEHIKL